MRFLDIMRGQGRGAEILRFLLVGGGCFVFDYGLMVLLTEAVGLYYLWSSGLSFTASVVLNYWLCVRFVFTEVGHQTPRQMAMFIGSSVTGLLLTQLCMYVQVDVLGIWYTVAKFVAAGIVAVWNYVWKRKAVRSAGRTAGQGGRA